MRFIVIFILLMVAGFSYAGAAPEVIAGCQGEGCDCFDHATPPEQGGEIAAIPAFRAFTVYSDMNIGSELLGTYPAGTMAAPVSQHIVILEQGRYAVKDIHSTSFSNTPLPVKIGDTVDTLIGLGEGAMKARNRGKWFEYNYDQMTLKEIRPTRLQEWMKIRVGAQAGYSKDFPFQGCLE